MFTGHQALSLVTLLCSSPKLGKELSFLTLPPIKQEMFIFKVTTDYETYCLTQI